MFQSYRAHHRISTLISYKLKAPPRLRSSEILEVARSLIRRKRSAAQRKYTTPRSDCYFGPCFLARRSSGPPTCPAKARGAYTKDPRGKGRVADPLGSQQGDATFRACPRRPSRKQRTPCDALDHDASRMAPFNWSSRSRDKRVKVPKRSTESKRPTRQNEHQVKM